MNKLVYNPITPALILFFNLFSAALLHLPTSTELAAMRLIAFLIMMTWLLLYVASVALTGKIVRPVIVISFGIVALFILAATSAVRLVGVQNGLPFELLNTIAAILVLGLCVMAATAKSAETHAGVTAKVLYTVAYITLPISAIFLQKVLQPSWMYEEA